MPIRTYNKDIQNPNNPNEKGAWINADPCLATRTKVIDTLGYYESDNVEGALKEIGEVLSSGDIGGIDEIRDRVDDLEDRVDYIEENGGSGGGSAMPKLTLQSAESFIIPTDGVIDIYYSFTSPNVGLGTAYISVDYGSAERQTISMGRNKYTIGNFEKGEHRIDIYVVDIAGMFSNTITINVIAGGLEISSKFDDSIDVTLQDHIRIRYNIDTISTVPIYVDLTMDGATTTVDGVKGENVWDIGLLDTMGVHEVKIQARSGDLISNILIYNLVVADTENLFVSSTYQETQVMVGKNIQIDYRNSMSGIFRFITELHIDDVLVDIVQSNIGFNFWNVGDSLDIGSHELRLQSFTTDRTYSSNVLIWHIEIFAGDYIPYQIVTHDLVCNFDANGKQQDSQNRHLWVDTSDNQVKCELFNFNYSTNGWIDNSLVFNGKTYAHVDLRPFELNCVNGLTIDILYKVKNVGDINGKVLWCKNYMTPYQGVFIDTYKANCRTNNSKIVECQFQDDTWTRMTWVIDRENGTMIQYVNAIITKVIFLSDREPFQFVGDVFLGASFDEVDDNLDDSGKPIPHYASCSIKNFRVYDCALTDDEVLQNHIADIKDRDEQLAKRELNFGESTIPIMKFEGNMDGMTGDIYKLLTVDYNDPLDPSKRFRKEGCQVSWQGTSSREYPIKNYTLKLRDGGNDWLYAPKDDWIPENRYTLKANF